MQTIGNGKVSSEIGKINSNFSSLDTSKITYLSNTQAYWDAQTTLVSSANVLYIYTDHSTVTQGTTTINVPGIKIGDGTTLVVNLPFVSGGGGGSSDLGDLAYKNSASGTYTPAGSVSVSAATTTNKTATVSTTQGTSTYTPGGTVGTPTISVATAGSTTTINNPTKATVATAVTAAAPGSTAPSNAVTYYNVSNETLSLYQLGYNTGDSITTTQVTVKTGDAAYQSSQPSWTGTGVRLVTGNIQVPATYSGSFSGTQATITVS